MSDDVLITPASRKIEFKDNSGNVDGKIELDTSGNLKNNFIWWWTRTWRCCF